MRLSLLLRHRRRLLMPLDPIKSPSPSPVPALKRPYAAAAHSLSRPSSPPSSDPPSKIQKLDASKPYNATMSRSGFGEGRHSSAHGPSLLARVHGQPKSSSSSSNSSRRRGGGGRGKRQSLPVLDEPTHSRDYVAQTYKTKPFRWDEDQARSPLSNFLRDHLGKSLQIQVQQGIDRSGSSMWRATIHIEDGEGINITAIGDEQVKREAEKTAILSAVYQLDTLGAFDKRKKPQQPSAAEGSPSSVTLSDGSVVDYDRARQFMDYYCRRFGFGKPDVSYTLLTSRGMSSWQADMVVGGRRIGFAKAQNKKTAMSNCYVDVTQYLESCDPDVWKQFVKDAATGKDIGLAPRVAFQVDETLEDQIHDLCHDIRSSSLYKHRPKVSTKSGSGDQQEGSSGLPTAPRQFYRPPAPHTWLKERSEALKLKREQYLNDPAMAHMRELRAQLPVFTKSAELLQHVREHDVTICMAATGSGKTTQIPQQILDEWIDQGEGAACNIVCTQPRRIAAISVADRVAKERGERAGRGSSVGYQVRFESNLPDEHGSITYCTTGIFLKRMQSALLGDAPMGRSLDDVTHVIVDEVHERDVDTDLLLVVLKRLLADRKARNKPIKIILMSATIDPTLFQQYFLDDKGKRADVIEIPGRAFPVEKRFLDEFVPKLLSHSSNEWVFHDEPVRKYLASQMGDKAPQLPGRNLARHHAPDHAPPEGVQDDDLELPSSLVALTIAHVLNSSDDGHVLVFLPGWDDIMNVQKALQDPSKSFYGINFRDTSKYSLHLLHSTIPVADQQVIFEPPPPGIRRIILSTNIAETSVTIPDVVYVVDTAKVKEQRYDPERHISSLVSAWVGSSNLNQRAGRAGRHRPGEYFGILSERTANALHPHQTVEMKRVDLSNVVMHIKALSFPGMSVEEVLAETIEPPAIERVQAAMKALQMVGALDSQKNLTSLGRVLLQLPVDVQMGRLVLYGCFFRCLDQALTLAAILTNRDPFLAPIHLKAEAQARKNSWTPEDYRSDALATLRAYNAWWDIQKRGHYIQANRFCSDNFLAKPTMLMIAKIKEHLLQSVYQAGIIDVSAGGNVSDFVRPRRGESYAVPAELGTNGDSLPLLSALLAIALQPKFAIRTGERTYRTAVDKVVFIHPSSVNHRKREVMEQDKDQGFIDKQLIAYAEKRQNLSGASSNPQKLLVTTSRLDPLSYLLFGAYEIDVVARGLECDGWLPIVGRQDILDDVERLKGMMEGCMLRVFEGIVAAKARQGRRPAPAHDDRESESGEEEDDRQSLSLSSTEIKELDLMTRDIVRILDGYNAYRVAMQSRHNSRPATPMGSPSSHSSRLPAHGGGSRSGYSTPYNLGSAYSTRPSTPSTLSRRF